MTNRQHSRAAIGVALAVAASFTLAINDVAIPFAYRGGFNPPTVVLLRYVFLIVVLSFGLLALGRSLSLPGRRPLHALGSGVASAAGAMGLLGAIAHVPLSLAVLMLYTFPFLTALFDNAYRRTMPSLVELACLGLALAGLAIALGVGGDVLMVNVQGIAFGMLSALGFALAFFWNGVALRDAEGVLVTLYMAVGGVIAVGLLVVATGSFVLPPFSSPGWIGFAVTAVFFTISFLGMFKAVELAGCAPTAMVLNLEPVFAIALAALVLGEELTWRSLVGGVMVVGAVVLSEAWRLRQASLRPAGSAPA